MELMINRMIETYPTHKIFITTAQNQLFLTASITEHDADPSQSVEQIYDRIAQLLSVSSYQIVQERCFGDIEFQMQLTEIRARTFQKYAIETHTPITYIEGIMFRSSFCGDADESYPFYTGDSDSDDPGSRNS